MMEIYITCLLQILHFSSHFRRFEMKKKISFFGQAWGPTMLGGPPPPPPPPRIFFISTGLNFVRKLSKVLKFLYSSLDVPLQKALIQIFSVFLEVSILTNANLQNFCMKDF